MKEIAVSADLGSKIMERKLQCSIFDVKILRRILQTEAVGELLA